MSARVNRDDLRKLRGLVEDLSDRDVKLKDDLSLFEDFFHNFPIPVTMWSITKEKTIISQKGNGFACKDAKNLEEMFSCPQAKQLSLEHHELALQGEKVDYFIKTEKSVYYAKLVPRHDYRGEVCGVAGISWDVTANAVILTCLENIHEITAERRGLHKEVRKLSERALKASRLRKLLSESEDY
jgi:predicted nucleic-acid-binding Zn-ribbon protein